MNTRVEFRVIGLPQTQAGTKSVPIGKKGEAPRGFRKVTEGGKDLKSWRQDVSAAAEAALGAGPILDGPVQLHVLFRFPMPKSRPKWARDAGFMLMTVKPDLDKLVRAIGDSCKVAGVIRDDGQICVTHSAKVEVWDGWTGARVRLTRLDPRAVLDSYE